MKRFGLYPLTKGFSNSYKTDFDPRITNAFGAAAFRVGHTLIPASIMNPIMSCIYDLDYLGIPIFDLSKWKSGVEDDRIDIIEDRLDNIENNIQKIFDKLQNNGK